MQEIAFEIDAQRVGRASGYIGGLTIERYTFTGATIPAGTRLAILTRAGVTIAAAEIAEGNAATVDTNTQEVADLLRYQPLGACESVYIALGNADDIIALIPAVMRKNWLDDEATHPPVPANRYPTKAELDQWLARFDERAAAAETAKADAQEAAAQAAQRATSAQTAKAAAETAKTAAQTAQGNAEAAQRASEAAATSAGESANVAGDSERAAISAKQSAETAQAQAQASEQAAKASEAAAKGAETAARASEQAANASEQAAASSETAAAESASAANASEQAAKASEQASAESATAAQASEQAAATSATAAEAAKTAAETAKTGAEAAQTAAASSATAAANSATAAAKSATDLADAVATAESLDGRLTVCEAGVKASVPYFAPVFDVLYERKLVTRNWGDCQIIATLHRGVILYNRYDDKCGYWLHPDGTITEVVTSGGAYLRFGLTAIRAVIADNVNKATHLFWEVSGQKHYTKFSGDDTIEDELLDAYPGHIGELTFGVYGVAGYNGHYILGDGTIIEREDAVALDESGNEVSIRFAKTAEFATAYKTRICDFFKNFYRSATFVTMFDWTQRKWFNVTDNEDGTASVTYSDHQQSSDASLVYIPMGDRYGYCIKKVASGGGYSTYYFYAYGDYFYGTAFTLRAVFNTHAANGILDMTGGLFIDGDILWVRDEVAQYRVLARGLFGAMNTDSYWAYKQLVSDFDGYTYLNLYVYYYRLGFPQRTYIFKRK